MEISEIAQKHKLKHFMLYTYSLAKVKKSTAVRFVYTLKGRNKEHGIIAKLSGTFLAPGCFIIPSKSDKEMQEVFHYWKIPFKRREILTY